MKHNFLLLILTTASFANINNINSFEADFTQKIVDDQNKTIIYNGHIQAKKPQYALWKYTKPINKSVYILENKAIIVEPELEQAILKKIDKNFDFFELIQNATKISNNKYLTHYNNTTFIIGTNNGIITSISYKDEFENKVIIDFMNQIENNTMDEKIFTPTIPDDYDVIRD